MKARLTDVSGWKVECPAELPLPIVLGRSRHSGLIVSQPLVSRQHCELYESGGKLMVRDLGSMNGTRVNQVRIDDAAELISGDLLSVGPVTFRIDCGDSPATLTDNRDDTEVVARANPDSAPENLELVPVRAALGVPGTVRETEPISGPSQGKPR
jgi:hypothetical protein